MRLPRLPLTRTASPGRSARGDERRQSRANRRHARRAGARGTASNRPRISGPQANKSRPIRSPRRPGRRARPAASPSSSMSPSTAIRRRPAAAAARPAPRAPRRRWRCSSRRAAARAAGQRPDRARARRGRPAARSRPARRRPRSDRAPSAATAASAATAFIAMCRPGAVRRKRRVLAHDADMDQLNRRRRHRRRAAATSAARVGAERSRRWHCRLPRAARQHAASSAGSTATPPGSSPSHDRGLLVGDRLDAAEIADMRRRDRR